MVLLPDVPLDESIDDLAFDPTSIDVEEVLRLFDFLEFNTLFDRLAAALDTDLGPSASEAAVLEAEVCQVATADEAVRPLEPLLVGERPLALAASWEGAEGDRKSCV